MTNEKELMTEEQLLQCARGLGPRDFARFARRVSRIDPVLGETVHLHAEAADGNSPDLLDGLDSADYGWIYGTLQNDLELWERGYNTPELARAWWIWKYQDGPEPMTSLSGEVL
jgi:hypothetical protein